MRLSNFGKKKKKEKNIPHFSNFYDKKKEFIQVTRKQHSHS